MRLAWDNPLWKKSAKKYGLTSKQTVSVNTIITKVAQAIGIHAHENTTSKGRPLPFNYYDCSLLVVNDTGHLRIIGIMGAIYNEIIALIPEWLRKERLDFFANTEKSRGFSALMNVTSDLQGKDPRCSRKAVKIWTSCLSLLCDAEMYGIHSDMGQIK